MAARLPTVGGDSGSWGTVLNTYLQVGHNSDGTHKGFYNVMEYGATGNGSTDDTAAIQSAIDAASTAGGGTVLFPSGTFISRTLNLKSKVFLKGMGRSRGTLLKLKNTTNSHLIQLNDANVEMAGISDMFLHGNNTNQSSGDVIHIDQTGGTGFEFNDAMLVLENLVVAYAKNYGVYVTGTSRSFSAVNVEVHNSSGVGWYIAATDCRLETCISAFNGLQGFYITGNNSHLNNCKSFYSGQVTAASGDGFYITAAYTSMSNCEAQDNLANGFNFIGASRPANVGFLADSNGTGATGSGLLLDNSSSGVHTGVAFDRQGSPTQQYGVKIANGSTYNIIQVSCRTNASGSYNGTVANNQLLIGANAASWIDSSRSHYELQLQGLGIVNEVYQRSIHPGTTIMIDGTIYLMAVGLRQGDVITNLVSSVSIVGASMTISKYGIYSKAGTLLASTNDLGTLLTGAGQKSGALSAAYTVPTTDLYYFAVFGKTSSAMPTLHRSTTNGNVAGAFNTYPLFGSVASQTDLGDVTLAIGGSPICFWMCAT